MLSVTDSIQIPLEEFEFSYARSGGPGGQNVNKVNSKAVLRWRVNDSPSVPGDVRARFLTRYANRLTIEGDLVLSSQRYRDQPSNVEDCLEKLKAMLLDVAVPPQKRKATRPTLASKRRRLDQKRQRSATKDRRRSQGSD